MQTVIPFILGGVFAALASLQHSHSVRGLWRRSIATSIGLGGIQYLLVRWAAKGDIAFWIFQVGCCLGAGLGSYLSSKLVNTREEYADCLSNPCPSRKSQ